MRGERAVEVGVLGAEVDVGHVAEADVAAVLADFDDDLAELLGRGQPAQRVEHQLIVLPRRAPAAGRCCRPPPSTFCSLMASITSLAVRSSAASFCGSSQARMLYCRWPEEVHQAHARHARQLVEDVDLGVVAQVERVVPAVRRDHVHRQQDVGRLHLHVDALLLHARRAVAAGQLHAGLHEHQRGVDVGADLEAHGERVLPVVRAGGRHVDHALHAVDLGFDRLADRVGHGLGARPGIRWRSPGSSAARSADTGRSAATTTQASPEITITMDSTQAKIGRSMKKRDIVNPSLHRDDASANSFGCGGLGGLRFRSRGLSPAGFSTSIVSMSTSLGSTFAPGRTRCRPSTMTRSVGLEDFDLRGDVVPVAAGLGDRAIPQHFAQAVVQLPHVDGPVFDFVLVVDHEHDTFAPGWCRPPGRSPAARRAARRSAREPGRTSRRR